MVYFDTSFLAPLLLEEATSDAVERFIASLPAGTLAISHWTRVEFASLLAREVRMGGLDRGAASEVDTQFEAIVAESFVVLAPSIRDFGLAKQYLGRHDTGLRAGDALHLAIAQNNGVEALYSLDKTLLGAGTIVGVTVSGLPTG
jgi:predicted nucleic acid-binding protein